MKTRLPLCREQFSYTPCLLLESGDFSVELFRYPAGIEAIRIHNRRGTVIVLPFLGQMVWDVNFDGRALTMGHRFKQPLPGDSIIDTYGCFAFHSGLLANGCPAAEDTHALHGEMACARMDTAWIVAGGRQTFGGGRNRIHQGVWSPLSGGAGGKIRGQSGATAAGDERHQPGWRADAFAVHVPHQQRVGGAGAVQADHTG
jgi:hypothetical protein